MEAVEFLRNYNRMCSTIDKCSECPAVNMKCCELYTDEQAKLVEIVEQWAKEHPEETERERKKTEREQQKPEREQQKPEHPEEAADATKPNQDEPCVKTIQDNIEGAIYRSIAFNKTRIENLEYEVSVIRHDLEVLDDRIYALREKVDHTPAEEPSQTQEQKRTNKDVLLAAFPNARLDDDGIPDICPRALDKNYNNCSDFADCSVCKCAYWLAEVEE